MKKFKDAFISYGRAESKIFAAKLGRHLTGAGFDIWIDQDDIPLGVDFQHQINEGIEAAHNFIFIIAPHAIQSPYCLKEIVWALKWKKRIIPILHIEPKDKAIMDQLHPEIAKINWLYMREILDEAKPQTDWQSIDDFEKTFAGLVNLVKNHADYVQLHSAILSQALEWDQKHKSTAYLLVGKDREEAEKWLMRRDFGKDQAPCEPSDLHCEFIGESKKNSNNLMTDLFLSYAVENREMQDRVRKALARENLTGWIHSRDIASGRNFEQAINEGIEQAANFLFFLTRESLASEYCMKELAYAVQLNKRIIPLQFEEMGDTPIPEALRKLQYINFAGVSKTNGDLTPTQAAEFKIRLGEVLKELYQDFDYFSKHTAFLVQTLKWERQGFNASILLRGYNLQNARIWLKQGKKRASHQPTKLQEDFITEGSAKSSQLNTEVFVCYSRKDSDFARKLNDALQVYGKTTWFDQESIAEGADFQREIYKGIEGADNFVFVITPDAILSPYCADEVEYAANLNKRFIPILYRRATEKIPAQLASVQWVNFEQGIADFDMAFSQLVRTVDTDREHVHQHTKWAQRAQEWQQNGSEDDLLLRGSEFTLAEAWLNAAVHDKKQPAPTELQNRFVDQSRNALFAAERAEKERQEQVLQLQKDRVTEAEARVAEQKRSMRRQRFLLVGVSGALLVAILIGIYALQQKAMADKQKELALEQKELAEQKTREAEESRKVALQQRGIAEQKSVEAQEQKQIAVEQQEIAVVQKKLAEVKSIEADEQRQQALAQRNIAIHNQVKILLEEVNRLRESDQLGALIAGSQAAQQLQQASEIPPDLQAETTQVLHELLSQVRERNRLQNGRGNVLGVAFSKDGSKLAVIREGRMLEIWSGAGKLLKSWKAQDRLINQVSFSPNDNTLACVGEDGVITLWGVDGKKEQTFAAHDQAVWDVVFSPNGQIIATASQDQTVKLWDQKGKLSQTYTHGGNVAAIAFSPDGKSLAAACWDGNLVLWDLNGQKLKTISDATSIFTSLAFSPDGKRLAAGNTNHLIKIWNLNGNEKPQILRGHQSTITNVIFGVDGQTLISGSADQSIKYWQIASGELLETFKGRGKVSGLSVHPSGDLIASASADQVKIWSLSGLTLPAVEQADVNELLNRSCGWLHDYLQNNVSVNNEEKSLCKGSSAAAKDMSKR